MASAIQAIRHAIFHVLDNGKNKAREAWDFYNEDQDKANSDRCDFADQVSNFVPEQSEIERQANACQILLDALRDIETDAAYGTKRDALFSEILKKARAALTRATGKE